MPRSKCNIFREHPITLADAKRLIGSPVGPDMDLLARIAKQRGYAKRQAAEWIERERKEWLAKEAALIPEHLAGPMFMCGEIDVAVCSCGYAADYLCDYPIGRGKTCDIALCEKCRKNVAEDRDLCLIHFAEFQRKSGVAHVNPWPPKRGRAGV